jgi:hypothetical protein
LSALFVLAALLGFCGTAHGADKYIGRCDVVFKVDSTMHAFTGDITNIALVVFCDTNASGEAVLNTEIEVAPRQLTTHHKKRDADMYKMFRPEQYPKLLAVVSNAPLSAANLTPGAPSSSSGRLPVRLTFCGVTGEVLAKTLNPQSQADGWTFDLVTDVSLKAFHIVPPSAMLGTLKVGDIVVVKAHVNVKKEAAKP